MNAKKELTKFLNTIRISPRDIKCADVYHENFFYEENEDKEEFSTKKPIRLQCNYTIGMLDDFFDSLDFDYDNGYGTQELFGTIWLVDNSYIERCEYDGSEWWSLRQTPTIPQYLR